MTGALILIAYWISCVLLFRAVCPEGWQRGCAFLATRPLHAVAALIGGAAWIASVASVLVLVEALQR